MLGSLAVRGSEQQERLLTWPNREGPAGCAGLASTREPPAASSASTSTNLHSSVQSARNGTQVKTTK